MLKTLRQLIKYLSYYRKSTTKHGVHSPFVYEFITKVLEDKTKYVAYTRVEEQRQRLLKNKNVVEIVDFGAPSGKAGYQTYLAKVQDIAKRSSISPAQGQLLYRIVKYVKPEIMLEMGTSLGISSIYQVSGSTDSFFIGIEGCATTAAIAEQSLKKFSEGQNYSLIIGNFDIMLPGVLEKLNKIDFVFIDGNHAYKPVMRYFSQLLPFMHEASVIVFHDIYWSAEMEEAWSEIKQNPAVTISIDLFHMGLVFFRTGMPKQDFIIRF